VSEELEKLIEKDGIELSVPDLEAIAQKAFILGRYAGVRQLAAYLQMKHSKNCPLTPGELGMATLEVNEAIKLSDRKFVEYEDGERA
jgi:hypothetical protein